MCFAADMVEREFEHYTVPLPPAEARYSNWQTVKQRALSTDGFTET